MSKKSFDRVALVAAAAAAFHEEWRKGWQGRAGNSVDTPRWKPTTDTAWLAKNSGKPYCQGGQVDLNIEFTLLPKDWGADNAEAAEIAVPIAIDAYNTGSIDDSGYEDVAGAAIHEAWCQRRRGTEGDNEEFKKLDIPFEQLEGWRQEQDKLQARVARALVLAAV